MSNTSTSAGKEARDEIRAKQELDQLLAETGQQSDWDAVRAETEAAALAKSQFRKRDWKRCERVEIYEASPATLGEFRASGLDTSARNGSLADTGFLLRRVYDQNMYPNGDQPIKWMSATGFRQLFKEQVCEIHRNEHLAYLAAELERTRIKLVDLRKALRVQSGLFSDNGIDYSLVLSSPLWEAKCRLEAAEQMLVLSLSKGAST